MKETADRATAQIVIPWHERPYLPVNTVAQLAGFSPAQVYKLGKLGTLDLRKIAGKTVVVTATVIRLLDSAETWTPSARNAAAISALRDKARRSRHST